MCCSLLAPLGKKKKMSKLIVFSAPSGSGKTTIVRHLLSQEDLNLEFSISAASRESRGEEANGKDYYFISTEEFKQHIKNDDFLEWEEVYRDNFYGTLKARPHLGQRKNVILILTLLVDCESNLNLRH
jgi:guanylate kinase